MTTTFQQLWTEEDGALAFEWTLLLTLLVIGIVGGVAAGRDAIIDELGDVAQVMLAVDQSYTLAFPLQVSVHTPAASSASDTSFVDALLYVDCDTTFPGPPDQQIAPGVPIDDFNPGEDDFG
jgi:Flp pilus assembly pilin Flp